MKSLIIYIVVCIPLFVSAQEIRCTATSSSSEIQIAEPVFITVSLTFPKNSSLELPEAETSFLKDFEVLSPPQYDTIRTRRNTVVISGTYHITSFNPGSVSFKTGPYILNQTDSIWSNSIQISITIPDVDMDGDIRELKDIKQVHYTWRDLLSRVLIIFAICILILAALYFGKKHFRKISEIAKKAKPEIILPAHIRALAALDELEKKALWDNQKQHYSELTDILRSHYEEVLSITTFEKTSDELLDILISTAAFSSEQIKNLKLIFSQADLVKFAKLKPQRQTILEHTAIARKLILIKQERQNTEE